MAKKPFLTFGSQKELVYFLVLLDRFLGLKLGRVAALLEPIRSCGMETYSWHGDGEDARAVSFVSTTKETERKLPTQKTSIALHLCDQQGQKLEIAGNTSFLHSQKLSGSFKLFFQENSSFKENFWLKRLLGRIHALAFERMEEYPDAQAFADANYQPLKDWMDSEEKIPF